MEAVIIVGIFCVILLAGAFNPASRLKRQLRGAPRFALAELSEATLGRVVGRAAVLRDQLTAPLTGRACVHYIAKVEQQQGKSWRTIITEERGVPFVLDDGTGRAIVEAQHARIALDFDSRSSSGTFDDPTEIERAFLDKHGQTGQGWIFNKQLRYREAIIEVGETVAVLGAGTREPDPEAAPPADYRGDQPTLLRLTSSASYPLVISDDPSTTRK